MRTLSTGLEEALEGLVYRRGELLEAKRVASPKQNVALNKFLSGMHSVSDRQVLEDLVEELRQKGL